VYSRLDTSSAGGLLPFVSMPQRRSEKTAGAQWVSPKMGGYNQTQWCALMAKFSFIYINVMFIIMIN